MTVFVAVGDEVTVCVGEGVAVTVSVSVLVEVSVGIGVGVQPIAEEVIPTMAKQDREETVALRMLPVASCT